MIIEKLNLISTGPEENRALFKRTSIKVRFSLFDPQCFLNTMKVLSKKILKI
jgi:hypothetical protein